MNVQAEISLYPLRTEAVGPAVESFVSGLKESSLETDTGVMSTRVTGELSEVFCGISNAFARVAEQHEAVVVLKVSNACPAENSPATGGTDV